MTATMTYTKVSRGLYSTILLCAVLVVSSSIYLKFQVFGLFTVIRYPAISSCMHSVNVSPSSLTVSWRISVALLAIFYSLVYAFFGACLLVLMRVCVCVCVLRSLLC